MKSSQPVFKNRWLPYLLIAPQLLVTLIFFIWPAARTLLSSVQQQDPFGLSSVFVGVDNFIAIFKDSYYLSSFYTTLKFCFFVTAISMLLALFFAALVDHICRFKKLYQTLFILPYAVSPAISAVLWMFIFSPAGILPYGLKYFGYDWNYAQNSGQAMFMVVLASSWKQISYNFLFFLAALQAFPKSLVEAAALDGAGPVRRFFDMVFPLISPTTFFLFIVNLVYSFFDTFPVIDATTHGGPIQATTTLVYKIYREGFTGLDLAASAAQSVVLMSIVIVLTVIQFKFVERKVSYQ